MDDRPLSRTLQKVKHPILGKITPYNLKSWEISIISERTIWISLEISI